MSTSNANSTEFCPSLLAMSIPSAYLVTFAALVVVMVIFTVVSNSLLIHALRKTKQLTTITNKLILLMNISDLITGVVAYPCIAFLYFTISIFRSCKFELTIQLITLMPAYFSFWMLMGVAVDRYLQVTKLTRYNLYMNDFRMKLIIAGGLSLSVGTSVISTVFSSSFWLKVCLNLSNISSVMMMFFIYTLVFKKIRTHSQTIRQVPGQKQNRARMRQMLTGARTVRFLLGALFVLYFPYNIISTVWAYYKFYLKTEPGLLLDILELISYLIVFSNAGINALIYGYGNSALRSYLIRLITKKSSEKEFTMEEVAGSSTLPNITPLPYGDDTRTNV